MKVKMAKDKYYGKTLRKNFARHEEVMPMPNLLEIQKTSYREFLDTGLREVFADVGAISDYQGNLELTFIDFRMDEAPKYNVEECKARDATYAAPLKVTVRLRNKETVYNNRKAAEDLRCPARFGRAGAWLRIFRRHRIVYMPHLIRRSSP